MDFIIEVLMTIILEGALESVTEKKVPLFIRVVIAVVLLVFYIGFGCILIYAGIKYKSGIVIGLAIFLLIIVGVVTFKKYNEIKTRH